MVAAVRYGESESGFLGFCGGAQLLASGDRKLSRRWSASFEAPASHSARMSWRKGLSGSPKGAHQMQGQLGHGALARGSRQVHEPAGHRELQRIREECLGAVWRRLPAIGGRCGWPWRPAEVGAWVAQRAEAAGSMGSEASRRWMRRSYLRGLPQSPLWK